MTTPRATPLRRRLEQHYRIPSDAGRLLDELAHEERTVSAGAIVMEPGHPNSHFIAIDSGWLYAHRQVDGGKRQIVNFLLPGDMINADGVVVSSMIHTVSALTDARLRYIDRAAMGRMLELAPALIAGLWWTSAHEKGLLEAQIVRIGRQRASIRVCHLLLELHRRLLLVDAAKDSDRFELPVRQQDLADALGLSPVHVSRVFGVLRRERLIRTRRNVIELLDRERIAELAGFDTSHFHLDASASDSLFDQHRHTLNLR